MMCLPANARCRVAWDGYVVPQWDPLAGSAAQQAALDYSLADTADASPQRALARSNHLMGGLLLHQVRYSQAMGMHCHTLTSLRDPRHWAQSQVPATAGAITRLQRWAWMTLPTKQRHAAAAQAAATVTATSL
jgi:hypothetical protein